MHDVQALIANFEVLNANASRFKNAGVCRLSQGLGLLPVTDAFALEMEDYQKHLQGSVEPSIEGLSSGLAEFAKHVSHSTPVVFISTFYFGGDGGQDAVVWINAKQVFGPLTENYNQAWPNGPISQSLRKLGVVSEKNMDEFDAVGLGRYRNTDKWAASI